MKTAFLFVLCLQVCCAAATYNESRLGMERSRKMLQSQPSPTAVIDFYQWKIQLPVGSPGNPDSYYGDALANLNNTYFQQTPTGIQFYTPTSDCVTTSGTRYCRSELREMLTNGRQASWGVGDNKQHMMTVRQAVRSLPATNPRVVVAQIHGGADDVAEVRCVGAVTTPPGNTASCRLEIFHDTTVFGVLDTSLPLGTIYTMTLKVTPIGTLSVVYQRGQNYTSSVLCGGVPTQASDAYFKTGAYVQSTETGSSTSVMLYGVEVSHI